jgi:short-subunit dehydrogenase
MTNAAPTSRAAHRTHEESAMSEHKVALVTGASSGIGRRIAQRLAQRGLTVFGTSRNPAVVEPIAGVTMLPLDVRDAGSVARCVQAVDAAAGRIDVLVNNAGYVIAGAVEEVSVEEATAQFATNFFGVMRLVHAVLPAMRQRRSGHVVNISSLAGLVTAPPYWGIYSASKFALEAYTEHLWREVRPFDITVSLIETADVRTNLARNRRYAQRRIDDYNPWRQSAYDASRALEAGAPDPTAVAGRVAALIERGSTRLRHRVGAQAVLLARLRQFLPPALFERLIGRIFHLHAAG